MNNFDDKTLAAAIPHGIVVLDQDYNWLWSNDKTKSFFNLQIEPEAKSIFTVLPFLQEEINNTDYEASIIKYQQHNFSIRLMPYQEQYYLLMIEDVTHTSKLEKVRQVFVANVSHELRTPLTVFSGYLEMLLEKIPEDKNTLLQILQQMEIQKHRMYLLVEDLLLLSSLENAELDNKIKEPVNILPMLEQIVAAAKQVSGDKNHKIILNADPGAIIYGSANELHSACSNLVYNAVHYTPENGKIFINCIADDNEITIEVVDTGIGIPKKDISHITERFYRVDKGRSWNEVGGTGLGLAIVKHVLIRHDAKLEIISELDKGSTFRCVFTNTGE